MKKDNIFALKNDPVDAFEFNEEVTFVFDDMIKRSVPFYMESLKRQCQLTSKFYQKGTIIYDLGCSHGNLGIMIDAAFNQNISSKANSDINEHSGQIRGTYYNMIAVDSSLPMMQKYQGRIKDIDNHKSKQPDKAGNIFLVCGLAEDIPIVNASVVIVNLTMQFIKPLKRERFIHQIYDGLTEGGILLLTEKIIHNDERMSCLEQDFYKRFKLENGYSELEISRKREALENILIPETLDSHTIRLKKAGFNTINVWLKWFNFASVIAIK